MEIQTFAKGVESDACNPEGGGEGQGNPTEASKDSKAITSVSEDPKKLTVRSLCVDHVRHEFGAGGPYIMPGGLPTTPRMRREVLRLCAKQALENLTSFESVYESTEASRDALWRTLVMNTKGTFEEAPAEWGSQFSRWIEHEYEE